MRIVLVSCCGPKASSPKPAKDLYLSPLFRISRAWAEQNSDRWFILSAKLHVVDPETTIAPYDVTLKKLGTAARGAWREEVRRQLEPYSKAEITVLAGAAYCEWCSSFLNVRQPLAGVSGIGRRIAWLRDDLAHCTPGLILAIQSRPSCRKRCRSRFR